MSMSQGFTLTDVLVSLLLLTSTSLAVLKNEWQVSQLFNEMHLRSHALTYLDNSSERLFWGKNTVKTDAPFRHHLSQAIVDKETRLHLQISWDNHEDSVVDRYLWVLPHEI